MVFCLLQSVPAKILTSVGMLTFSAAFNAALVIFGCLLLKITASLQWAAVGASITPVHAAASSTISEMVTRLGRAVDALQRFGEGTKSAKRIRKTLSKLMQRCITLGEVPFSFSISLDRKVRAGPVRFPYSRVTRTKLLGPELIFSLVQSSPDFGPAVLSTLSVRDHPETFHVPHQNPELFPPHSGDAMGSPLPPMGPYNPFAALDTDLHQLWTENDLDLFTDLGGVESGLTALMAA